MNHIYKRLTFIYEETLWMNMIYNLHQYFHNLQKIFTPFRKKSNENKNNNISNKIERRCRDVETLKACKQGEVGPQIKQTTSFLSTIKRNTKSCTYVGLYGSGLFNFGSHLTFFACFLGFDIPTSSFIFIGNVFFLFL